MLSDQTLGNSTIASSTFGTSTSSTSTMALSFFSTNLMSQPLLLLSNMANMMPIKLDSSNYIVWKHQITMVLETYRMFDLLDEFQPVPDKFLKDLSSSITTMINPDFQIWKSKKKKKKKALLTL